MNDSTAPAVAPPDRGSTHGGGAARRTLVTITTVLALLAVGVVAGYAAGGTGTVDPPPRVAFLANGLVPADALAAGPVAGRLGAPMYTTPADALSPQAAEGIVAYAPELVVVLGGPVAVTDAVIEALSGATGLPVLAPEQLTEGSPGIVRVAGGDRFATARAVADLVSAFDPAFLPVDATARDADQLDGLDASAFARADRACPAGQVAVGTAADGGLACAADAVDGGDAATVDGLDGSDLVVPGEIVITSGDWTPQRQEGQDQAGFTTYGPYISTYSGDGSITFINRPSLPASMFGVPLELVGVELCQDYSGGSVTVTSPKVTVWQGFTQLSSATGSFASYADACDRMDFATPVELMASNRHVGTEVTITGAGEMALLGVQYFLQPVTP